MWSPRFRFANANPLIAQLSASVPPEVMWTSPGEALIASATCSRAWSTAAFASPAIP